MAINEVVSLDALLASGTPVPPRQLKAAQRRLAVAARLLEPARHRFAPRVSNLIGQISQVRLHLASPPEALQAATRGFVDDVHTLPPLP